MPEARTARLNHGSRNESGHYRLERVLALHLAVICSTRRGLWRCNRTDGRCRGGLTAPEADRPYMNNCLLQEVSSAHSDPDLMPTSRHVNARRR